MSLNTTPGGYRGVVRVSHQNPNTWWFVLIAANVGALVLLLMLVARPVAGSRVPGLVIGLLLWAVTNAVLIPVAVSQMRKHLTLDFDRGILATGGSAYPAAEFSCAVETTRLYPGRAHMLTLVYAGGGVDIQVDGFAPSDRSRARNEAVLAFVFWWLPMPDQHRSHLESGPLRVADRIGRQEVAALLRAG